MELLFITPAEMTSSTILSGNTDTDKFLFCIANVQLTVVEPLLGTLLYDKLVTDITNNTLSGLYLTMYTDLIKPLVKNESCAQYIEISSYMLDNGGLYKHTGENMEIVSKDEAQFLAGKWKTLAQAYVNRFYKWICKNNLPEYKCYQDEVNARKGINLNVGWHL